MNCNVNGNLASTEEVPVSDSMEDPGVVEVMASPESEGPFTEEMINQVITMLQTEGQITPETHTVIVHTNSGTTLRVQLQQVDGTELENDNIEELAPDAVATEDDQLVYVGQASEDFHADAGSHHHQLQQQQQYCVTTSAPGAQLQLLQPQHQILQHQQILQNGGQFMTVAEDVPKEQLLGTEAVTSEYKTSDCEEVGIPAALMSNVAEQVLQAATLMDGGYKNTATVVSANTPVAISEDISSSGAVSLQQQTIDMNGGMNVFPQSLENGVSWSIGTDQLQSVYSSPLIKGNLHQVHNLPLVSHEKRSLYKGGTKLSNTSQNISNSLHHSESFLDPADTKSKSSYLNSSNMKKSFDQPIKASHTIEENLIKIRIDTGRNDVERVYNVPPDVIRISTTTGLPKTRSTKFVRCPTCVMQLSSETALLQHMRHGCSGSRKRTSYECTYCSAKFSSKIRTVEHLKVCTMRTQVRSNSKTKTSLTTSSTGRVMNRKPATQTVEVEINSDEDETNNNQEENIVYDDDEDIEMDLAADNEDYESQMSKVSQKHLGPILMGGKFKCRDCDRTFNKDSQYNRHIGACTNAPLNASRIDDPEHTVIPEKKIILPEKKRGRPRKVYPDSKSVVASKVSSSQNEKKAYSKVISHTTLENGKDDVSDMDWGFLATPKKVKNVERNTVKKSNHIMQVLKENLADEDLVDGSKDLSESFLQCLDGTLNTEGLSSKESSPNKSVSAVCGLCVRHMNSTEELAAHISDVHAKDIVNMHAILSNNTDLTTHKCSMCDLHFVSTESVREHILAKHLTHLKENYRSLSVNSLDLPCPWCDHKSMTKELFQQHLASEHAHHFPETALNVPALKPEELSIRSLKAGSSSFKEHQQDMLAGRLCLKCGLAISSVVKLEEHLASCKTDQTSRLHPCHFPDCSASDFESLAALVAHTEEEHRGTEGCERRLFPNTSLFASWLDQEERQSQQKFVKATSRVRGGCCYTTYLCQSYSREEQPSSPTCFARLHVKTRWCHAKFDYSGRTEVMFYKEHHHAKVSPDTHSDMVVVSENLKGRFMACDRSCSDDVAATGSCGAIAATVASPASPASTGSPASLPSQHKEEEEHNTSPPDLPLPATAPSSLHNNVDNSNNNSNNDSSRNNNNNNNDDDEYFSSSSSSCKAQKVVYSTSSKNKVGRPPKSAAACSKRSREEIESDEEFYPTPKRKSLKGTNNSKNKIGNNVRKGRSISGQPPSKKSKLEEQEETTYVLPANLLEWCKLFDMVQAQISNGLIKKADVTEARSLLKHQTRITELSLEEQVRVFHRLCSLANIQVD
ncbi:Zinc finger C2H2-type [Trinorchestia longiramus]|nr:Zinc finger C2H2-type [Trinorchestia longiramus]